jgi:predicted PurR-regulated permease PerM
VYAFVAGAVYLVGLLGSVLLLLFSAILLAVFLTGTARLLRKRIPVNNQVAVLGVVGLLTLLTVAFGWFFGPTVVAQTKVLRTEIPNAIQSLENISPLLSPPSDWREQLLDPDVRLLTGVATAFRRVFGVFVSVFVAALVGVYLALAPKLYTRAAIALVPPKMRPAAERLREHLRNALLWWLGGRLASMVVVGVLTTIGLFIAGVPLALSLGTIAGLLSFVPFVGPIVSAVPGLLVALGQSPKMMLYALLVYAVVQFLEGNFITPLIQQRTVSLPPAGLITAQLVMGTLFGALGVFVATPLAVVLVVLVQALYVQNTLGDDIQLLAER